MNIKPIYPRKPIFTAQCLRCEKNFTSDMLFADLEGETYKAYYCADCINKILLLEDEK